MKTQINKVIFFSILYFILQIFPANDTYSQFTSLPVRLVTSTGTPLTGQAANIEFTRYPHNYPGNSVSGITVTEVGTAGNYVCRGFTAFEYVKLWLSGVNQSWFDSVQVGDIRSWLASNYMTLSTTQSLSGQKSPSGSWFLSGSWLQSAGDFQVYKPYITGTSPWLTDFSQLSSTSLMPRVAADSFYMKREFVFYSSGDNKLYFNTTGSLSSFRIAKRGNGQLFDFNPAQFSWSPASGLNFNTNLLSQDSIAAKNFTSVKDTTWFVLGEPVTKYRYLTLKKPFWYNPSALPFPDWKWYYRSVDETGATTARDSFIVMNHTDMTIDETPAEVFGVDTWSDVDTVTLPVRGTYIITYDCSLIFPYSVVSGVDARDTVMLRVINEFNVDKSGSYTELWKDFKNAEGLNSQYYQPESNPVSKTFFLFNPTAGTRYILQIRADLNTSLVNAAVTKPQMTYLLVR